MFLCPSHAACFFVIALWLLSVPPPSPHFSARGLRSGRGRGTQQALGGDFSAWRGRWIEYCGAARRTVLLRHAAVDQYSARPRNRSRRLFWLASRSVVFSAALAAGSFGDRACRWIPRPDTLPFRRAGFHGVRHARYKGHGRWLAESDSPGSASTQCIGRGCEFFFPRHRHGAFLAAHSFRQRTGGRDEQYQRFRGRRPGAEWPADREHLRSDVRPVGGFRFAWIRGRDV